MADKPPPINLFDPNSVPIIGKPTRPQLSINGVGPDGVGPIPILTLRQTDDGLLIAEATPGTVIPWRQVAQMLAILPHICI